MLLSNDHQQGSDLVFGANGARSHRTMTGDQESAGSSIPPHPLGIKPLGNKYFSSGNDARDSLKGPLRTLPDEMLMQLLEYLDQRSLRILGSTCRFLFANCNYDDLWKSIFLSESKLQRESSFEWRGSWRATVLDLSPERQAQVDCSDVFSDVLHRPFVCSHISLTPYASNIPAANEIHRLGNLSYEEFAEKWSNKPFILTDCIKAWPAYQSWNLEVLAELYSDVSFRAEAVDWTFRTYAQYMANQADESPLYLFDRKFAEKMELRVGQSEGQDLAYWNPECFGSDLFELLGAERPAHRWLITGPERSGSTFHKDPNATSAWNAVLKGQKYWIMCPGSISVPGVFVSEDSSEVTSPLSIAEWLLEFHFEARRTPGFKEGICRAGEILHVPSGWWHLVVNLEAGIALTQNFVPKSHLADVLSFLRDRPEQVSGFDKSVTDPYSLFADRLKEVYPDLLDDGLKQLADRQKKRRWDMVVGGDDTRQGEGSSPKKATGFSFGFGFGDEDDEIP
ncbi:Clavaminate synthase-like protein [Cercophora newfieldiana]|uniref:Clavaminate synthase-like protein n=1 Tax=Cercophora newfieldiana TaxID=92897 RepID=A0AA39YQF7_9PEZI|nr:Clavaminate synthase-like protein [Cercophora newfieldiana]